MKTCTLKRRLRAEGWIFDPNLEAMHNPFYDRDPVIMVILHSRLQGIRLTGIIPDPFHAARRPASGWTWAGRAYPGQTLGDDIVACKVVD